ncbi:MAG TPA: hypothetical protein PK228_18295 [Saprospiraceae bacterium]|nr:hypothetical protein [Saprospiraceae bacterium]
MSVEKNTYGSATSQNPRYIRAEKDSGTSIIIIDDVTSGGLVDVHTEVNREIAWLKISPGFSAALLDDEPSGITAFSPAHSNWSKTRILVQDSEVFVVKYTSTAKTTQDEVTGYSMGVSDVVFVKIDQQADTVTVYQ